MFEQVQERLRTIDTVLSEEWMNIAEKSDRKDGFDPSKDYTEEELDRLIFIGPTALKKTGKESKYVLLEVKLEEGGKQFSDLYLRGFDYIADSHPVLTDNFLMFELCDAFSDYIKLPRGWPMPEDYKTPPPSEVVAEKDGLKVTVTALGGGKFDLKDNQINLRGSSKAFGPVPSKYQVKLAELLGLLVQKPAYQGFQINLQ